jgi:hypothetical protein
VLDVDHLENYATDILAELLPDQSVVTEVDIEIHESLDGETAGYCTGDSEYNLVELSLTSHGVPYSMSEIATHLAHELVHVKQHVMCGDDPQPAYTGPNDPWELEAYEWESVLKDRYWNK